MEGKGRSDFEIALLERSEQIDRECGQKYSQAVSKLTSGVKSTFDAYR